ncbi:aldolase/citrate lyase family protein [Kibdelosporangium phytohabitans]|uniref:Alpha-dehydro-beta-deoxy-D-glucarate aldolase n=1 Tax=Kibdelosporangium phytohabitans TaxID=860235 RepID=A0A0N9HZR1_9PSEU|nr:aldolase/citrate lyase family protein [Kibdelosporangium phytohabitans]ALG09218.1 alpha-dehydro-beta-deoxy-D-glucarate aldolase [Kibdelosporangium phytohabitans]MBE1469548.1 4-hydroxy-2-oxoheptanedioate aldolase [Kibdelosporangium phytohabitans]
MPVRLAPTFRDQLSDAARPQVGMWVCSGSTVAAEICAGAGLDWLLLDTEHSPLSLETLLTLLQTVAAYPVTPVVRASVGDAVVLKRLLDVGVQNLLVPMVDSAKQAEETVRAVRYPPRGVRGVGSALSRSARWNRVAGYLDRADEFVSLCVQIESVAGVEAASEIAAVDGVDGVFVGPSDLAASLGLLGQQTHPEVTAAVLRTLEAVREQGKPVGVNAFDPEQARRYLDAGASFILVGADTTLLAAGSDGLAKRFIAG